MLKSFLIAGHLLLMTGALFAQRELKNPLIDSKEVITKAVALHDAGKYKEAITEYQKVPVSDTNYAQVLTEMVISYYTDSNYKAAEKYAKIGLEMFPEKKVQILRLLADIYDDTERSAEALPVYDSILAMNPYDYLTYFNKAISLYRQEKVDEATVNFQKTVMLNPYYSSAHYFLGVISMQKGNLVEAMLSFITNLLVSPGNKYYQKAIAHLSAIAQVNNNVTEYLKKYKAGRENNFESVQDIITSKIALDRKYKLKVDLEDQIIRQLQVMFEKLEYNPSDKGFWMQYYVPAYSKIWSEKQFEPIVFYMFSELDIDKVKSYVRKEKKDIEKMSGTLLEYFNTLRKTQQLDLAKRENAKIQYYISNYQVIGKGEYGKNDKNEDILVGPWEFYYTTGKLKSKGVFDNQGMRTGSWNYYYEDGKLKETTWYRQDKAEGKNESWHDNGLKYISSNYKDDETDGVEYMYFFNGHPRSVITYKNGKKEGIAKYYTVNGTLSSTNMYVNDMKDGEELAYYESGKLFSKGTYSKDDVVGEYTEYHENGKVLKTGSFADGKSTGLWKWFYDNGQPEYTGTYVKGELDGEYLSYYKNGKLESRTFYKKGEVDGKKENYDDDGVIFCETIFERGRLRDIKFFDKKGNVISNTTSRKGNADISFYQPDGSKTRDGYFTKDGLQEGKGFNYYKNGKIQSEAFYKDGLLEGIKKTYYANGKLKEEGNYTKDAANGYFVTYYNNGTVSEEGWYVDGDKQGTFLFYDQMGNISSKVYYLNGRAHGVAEYFHPDGKLNYTEYNDNDWFKKVVQMDTLGNVLSVSELNKGEGKVLFKHYNGKPYFESNYKYYKLNGQYKTTNGDGSVSSTVFYKNGDIDSVFKSWHTNGKLRMEVKYANGKRTGEWKYYLRSGSLSETEIYEDGRLTGKDIQYNENGTVDKEYEYKEGNLDGAVKFYAENKQLAVVLYYKDDELTGYSYEGKDGNLVPVIPIKHGTGKVTAYFKNGNKSAEMNFSESYVDGDRVLYYSNGKEYVVGKRINGDDHGLKKVFYPSGKIMKEENYYYGNLHGNYKYYAENGTLISDLNFYNSDMHGVSKYYENGKLTETLVYYYDMLESKK
jgi:antitoxin component YwqK of YwqJK toxin-antitoxin module/Flp pilus assembly protein TadD